MSSIARVYVDVDGDCEVNCEVECMQRKCSACWKTCEGRFAMIWYIFAGINGKSVHWENVTLYGMKESNISHMLFYVHTTYICMLICLYEYLRKKWTIENMIFVTFKMYHCSKWWKLWELYLSSKTSQAVLEYNIILFPYNFFNNYYFLFYCYLSRNMTEMRSSKGKWPGNISQRSLIIIKNVKKKKREKRNSIKTTSYTYLVLYYSNIPTYIY